LTGNLPGSAAPQHSGAALGPRGSQRIAAILRRVPRVEALEPHNDSPEGRLIVRCRRRNAGTISDYL